tara:strand:+ start:355 stop:609 length:255 start_codon:yes stop_codon:yes gene_type:complete
MMASEQWFDKLKTGGPIGKVGGVLKGELSDRIDTIDYCPTHYCVDKDDWSIFHLEKGMSVSVRSGPQKVRIPRINNTEIPAQKF